MLHALKGVDFYTLGEEEVGAFGGVWIEGKLSG
jgi:hypothetical protein